MPKQVRLRRGTQAQHVTFTGAEGEVTFDTTRKCLILHDGITAGGKPIRPVFLDTEGEGVTQVLTSALQISGGTADGETPGLWVNRDAFFAALSMVQGRLYVIGGLQLRDTAISYATSVQLDFLKNLERIDLTGNCTFTTANVGQGRYRFLRIKCDGTGRTLTFPGSWTWVGSAAPTSIAANKTALLELWVVGGNTDAEVIARWTVQP